MTFVKRQLPTCLRSKLLVVLFAVGAIGTRIGSGADNAHTNEVRPATDRPQPKSPEDSAKCVRLPPGFRLEVVAAEPLLREPTAMCFDERGRLFVCEIHGYNLDGYLDI